MKFNVCHFIGCGGTGSYLSLPLTQLLLYHTNGCNMVRFYDGDNYEAKNHNRQAFPATMLGLNKAKATEDRVLECTPAILAADSYEFYVDKTSMKEALLEYHNDRLVDKEEDSQFQLIVVAVDNEQARNDIITAADECAEEHNVHFAMVLPGNEYDTAMVLWYCRRGKEGTVFKSHPFDNALNWKEPTDLFAGSCQNEVLDHPQLLTANFAAAFMSLMVIEKLLNDQDIPYKIEYSGQDMSVTPLGRFVREELQ